MRCVLSLLRHALHCTRLLRTHTHRSTTDSDVCHDHHTLRHPEKQIFRRMHAAFVDAASNPFYQQGAPLASPRFDASIRTIATSLGAS